MDDDFNIVNVIIIFYEFVKCVNIYLVKEIVFINVLCEFLSMMCLFVEVLGLKLENM